MKIISLKSFAESGKFGSIGIGSLKTDVIKELGNEFDHHDGGETEILQYGRYEFFFWSDSGKLFGIQNDHLLANCINHDEMILFKNHYFEIDTWFLKVDLDYTYKQVIELLDKEKVKYHTELPGENEPEIIRFGNGTFFDFSEGSSGWDSEKDEWYEIVIEKKEDFLLNGIRIFDLKRE